MSMALRTFLLSHARRKWLGAPPLPVLPLPTRMFCWFCTAVAESSQTDSRLFVRHSFFKSKAVLSLTPGKPVFKKLESGAMVLDKEGTMFMEFAPGVSTHQYDWTRKQIFALSVVEMGGLIGLTTSDTIEFYHDPHVGSSNAGLVKKVLKVDGMPDKSGYYFNLSVSSKLENVEERFTVPVTKGEFAVMRSSFNYIIPYLMGWHTYVNMAARDRSDDKVDPELEWAK